MPTTDLSKVFKGGKILPPEKIVRDKKHEEHVARVRKQIEESIRHRKPDWNALRKIRFDF